MVLAEHIGETQVDELDLMLLDQVENFLGGHGETSIREMGIARAVKASTVPTAKSTVYQAFECKTGTLESLHAPSRPSNLHQFSAN
ncbi:hypothetical protein GCM10007863_23250 [Dyella mobilis]|nr:hypothetical protein GCM10007863_23250 [Dyella mobilis]